MAETDLELLRRYARLLAEDAFAEVVQRHLRLVYSAALRQVRSPQLAEEVSQSVFLDLARQSDRLAPSTILTAWLYQVTRRTAIDVVRRESRRQLREQIATEMNAMNATTDDWRHVEPLLDEAMEALDATDRAAVLLRYFENKSLREVGTTLGTSDDAAQKRVSRAVERLREFFAKRGVSFGATGLVVVISANAVQAAPAGLVVSISTAAALAETSVLATTAASTATKAIVMTTLQKAIIGATAAAAVGAGIYEARQASHLQMQVQTLKQTQAPLTGQLQRLQKERDDMAVRLANMTDELARAKSNSTELLKLRGELTQLRGNMSPGKEDAPINAETKMWLDRINKLRKRVSETPGAAIPEFRFLKEHDYLTCVNTPMGREWEYLQAMGGLRGQAEWQFIVNFLTPALTGYSKDNDGKFPADLAELQPYFPTAVEEAILARWKIAPANTVRTRDVGDPIITEKAAVDEDWDSRYAVGLNGFANAGRDEAGRNGWGMIDPKQIIEKAVKAYQAAQNGQQPTDPSQLLPYLSTPEQQEAYQKYVKWQQTK